MMNTRAVTAIMVAAITTATAAAQSYSFSTLVELSQLNLTYPPGGIIPFFAGVAVDGAGNVYAVQAERHAVFKLTPSRTLSVFAGAPLLAGSVDGAASDARFMARTFLSLGIAADAEGNVYVADEGNCTVRKITPEGRVTTLAGKAGAAGNDDGLGSEARFQGPISLCVHVDGDLYVVDGRFPQTIRRITPQGAVFTLAKFESRGVAGLNGVAVDRGRNVFVACYDDVVRKISSTAEVTIFAGRPGTTGFKDGKGGEARFSFSQGWFDAMPLGLAVDSSDNLFAADPGSGRVRRITPEAEVTTVTPGQLLYWPSAVAVDRASNLYVADAFLDSKVVKGTPSPTFNIVTRPQSRTVAIGSTAVFTLEATDSGVTYQWVKDGAPLVGATKSSLIISSATTLDSGAYACRVTDWAGVSASFNATLNVAAAHPSRLANLSARADVGSGPQPLAIGVTIGGTSAERTMPLLLRVAGPSLSRFFPTGFVNDPAMNLRSPTQLLMSNDNWNGDPQIAAWTEGVGAFPYNSVESRDAALATALPAGNYILEPLAKDASAGLVHCEVFDATSLVANAETSARLINLSARAQLGVNQDVLAVGFVIAGSVAKTVLLRAVGPSLASFGLTEGVGNPMLQLYERSTLMRENRDWGGDEQLTEVTRAIQAFPLSSRGSRDAVLLVTLMPGEYTLVVREENASPGVVLAEVYEVP